MFKQLLTIARNTFVESIRQPIFVVVIMVAAMLLVLNPSLSTFTMDDDNKMMIDMGLSTLFLSGLFLAAFTAAGAIGAEIENRTVLTVVSKPVARPLFVLGKFIGISGAMALAYWILSAIFLLTVRHGVMQTASDHFDGPVLTFGLLAGLIALMGAMLANYFYQWVFASTFVIAIGVLETLAWVLVLLISSGWQLQSPLTDLNGQLLIAMMLIFEALVVLTAVAVAASTRLGQIMTLLVCAGVFFLGLIGHALLQQFVQNQFLDAIFGALIPNLQYLWQSDALTQQHAIPGSHVWLVTIYGVGYLVAILSVAIALFQTREVG